jgi:hypothetical protein
MIKPVNLLSSKLAQRLSAIEPGVWGTPCAVVLNDGTACPLALAWENPRFSDAGDWINPDMVAWLAECPGRMPAKFARVIKDAGESGMGYHLYVVHLFDGNSFIHISHDLGIDFLDLPEDYTAHDVTGVEPHAGRQRILREGYRFVSHWESLEYFGIDKG